MGKRTYFKPQRHEVLRMGEYTNVRFMLSKSIPLHRGASWALWFRRAVKRRKAGEKAS